MNDTTRAEHLAWCKQRALAYLDAGEPVRDALASMFSDLRKHDETTGHPAVELGAMLLLGGHLSTPTEVRRFIEGFN
jgi:hypothetical protein